jgi:hypothetical protein
MVQDDVAGDNCLLSWTVVRIVYFRFNSDLYNRPLYVKAVFHKANLFARCNAKTEFWQHDWIVKKSP